MVSALGVLVAFLLSCSHSWSHPSVSVWYCQSALFLFGRWLSAKSSCDKSFGCVFLSEGLEQICIVSIGCTWWVVWSHRKWGWVVSGFPAQGVCVFKTVLAELHHLCPCRKCTSCVNWSRVWVGMEWKLLRSGRPVSTRCGDVFQVTSNYFPFWKRSGTDRENEIFWINVILAPWYFSRALSVQVALLQIVH